MTTYRDQGIVLRTYKLGEADRIVNFITRDHGKVRAVAKGVRKTRSKFGARLEPMSHVALLLYSGRSDLQIVTQAESVDHFRAIRDDLDRLGRAIPMLEAVDQISQEAEVNPQLYQMLLGALRTLAADDPPLVVAGFFWKALALEGVAPYLDACANCGRTDELVAIDLDEGGVRCSNCRRGIPISAEALSLLRDMLGGRLGAALNTPASAATAELVHLATRAMEHHLERGLRSPTVLDH